jgi:hypothetical protein
MHQSRLGAVVIDCKEPADLTRLADFWARALGLEIAKDQPDDKYVALVGPAEEVRVIIQRVEHEPRVHIDIETDDQEAEAQRLMALGAKPVGKVKSWHVLEAPSGHRFCLINPSRQGFEDRASRWGTD